MVGRKRKLVEKSNGLDKSIKKKTKKQKITPAKDYNIPKEKFMEILNVVHEEIEWGNEDSERRCSVAIHQISPNIRQSYKNTSFKLLEEARLCVQQRDWKNLATILTMAKPSNKREHILFFQVFVRYAVICLAHNPDKGLLDMFMQGVASCGGDLEKEAFIKSLTCD